jgi:hypothetical protein
MKRNAIHYCLHAMLVGLIAMSGGRATASERMSSAAVNAGATQYSGAYLLYEIYVPVGLAHRQTLRYTWANLNDPDPRNRDFEPLRILVRLLAADGGVIAQTEAAAVGAGEFQSCDFDRDQFSLPGEAGTGRLQARLEVTVTGQTLRSVSDLKQVILKTFADSIEVIDNSNGRTYVNLKSFQIISAGKDYLIGIGPGQTLRVSALNPLAPADDREHASQIFQVTAMAPDGRVIAQSDEITLAPGKFQFVDLRRANLPLADEADGRLQARVRVIWKNLQLTTEFPSSVELVDDSTGKTTVLVSQKPKEIVVVGSK